MPNKLKPRKCRNKKCRVEFEPATEWQKYCSIRCRSAVGNAKRAKWLRTAQRLLDAQQKAAV